MLATNAALKAPYPYHGGKRNIAPAIWQRLGDTVNYVEPFFGSGAMLLARPFPVRTETVNDIDGYIVNFWRAVQAEPDAVAHYADWPVTELDLHARGDWLYYRPAAAEWRERLRSNPDYYDAKSAGWWVWFASCWIGSLPVAEKGGEVGRQLPHVANKGRGVNRQQVDRKRPQMPRGGRGVYRAEVWRQKPYMAGSNGVNSVTRQRPTVRQNQGTEAGRAASDLAAYMQRLQERMRRVRVLCGDWSRLVTPSVTVHIGLTAVFLDPPYSGETGRDGQLYSQDNLTIAHDVREWCMANGDNPRLRIALCGYEGEHDELEQAGWDVMAWSANGGYSNQSGNDNRHRERVWFSPHCLRPDMARGKYGGDVDTAGLPLFDR